MLKYDTQKPGLVALDLLSRATQLDYLLLILLYYYYYFINYITCPVLLKPQRETRATFLFTASHTVHSMLLNLHSCSTSIMSFIFSHPAVNPRNNTSHKIVESTNTRKHGLQLLLI